MVTSRRPSLAALAERCGILPSYVDTQGQLQFAPEATQIAILDALGFDASTEAAAQRLLQSLSARQGALLEPTALVSPGEEAFVQLAFAAGDGTSSCSIEWRLRVELETGESWTCEGRARSRRRGRIRLPLGRRLPMGYHRAMVETSIERTVGGKRRSA